MTKQKLAKINKLSTAVSNINPLAFEQDQQSELITNKVIESALSQKSLDTVAYDVSKISNIARCLIIASGTSFRHVKGICDKIKLELERDNISPTRIDGYEDGEWIVMDFDDIIVHLFFEPKRQYYEFDSLFIGAEKIDLPDDLKSQARQLKTGLHAI